MTQNKTYTIDGMTCNGCVASVKKQLESIPEIINADVDLTSKTASIKSNSLVSLVTLRSALSTKYNIDPVAKNQEVTVNSTASESKLQQLKPLLLILSYITVASVLLHYKSGNLSSIMIDFMGLFFIVFSFFKMLDLKGFPISFRMYDPLAKAIPIYANIYPFIETALGLMFLMRFKITIALIVTLIILSITTVGVIRTLLDKKKIQCACLGTALKLPMTEATLIENGIMLVMVIIMLSKQFILF